MIDSRTVLIVLLLILLVALVLCSCKGIKENYTGMMDNSGISSLIYSPTRFHSNLDPVNPSVMSDPYAYGGFIKGASCASTEELAFDNKGSSADVHTSMEFLDRKSSVKEGFEFASGQAAYKGGLDNLTVSSPSNDFSSMVGSSASVPVLKSAKYMDTLEYTTPKELLPTPDMRQTLMKDPSDPSNFMYDRTLFAPLKKRNPNEADRFRGDLDIEPIKTGWFDIATNPSTDLVKGYFGYYNDITEYQDIQDVAYTRARDTTDTGSSKKLNQLLTEVNSGITNLNPPYAPLPPLKGPVDKNNSWYNENTKNVARGFDM